MFHGQARTNLFAAAVVSDFSVVCARDEAASKSEEHGRSIWINSETALEHGRLGGTTFPGRMGRTVEDSSRPGLRRFARRRVLPMSLFTSSMMQASASSVATVADQYAEPKQIARWRTA